MGNHDQRELRAGAGDAFAKAFEMTVTPGIFGLGGWWIDSRLDLFPLFTLVLALGVFGYQLWRFMGVYREAMDDALQKRRASYSAPPQGVARTGSSAIAESGQSHVLEGVTGPPRD